MANSAKVAQQEFSADVSIYALYFHRNMFRKQILLISSTKCLHLIFCSAKCIYASLSNCWFKLLLMECNYWQVVVLSMKILCMNNVFPISPPMLCLCPKPPHPSTRPTSWISKGSEGRGWVQQLMAPSQHPRCTTHAAALFQEVRLVPVQLQR